MDYYAIRHAGGLHDGIQFSTPLDHLPLKKNLDKFRGCLIGGAAGDALGYAVEFLSEPYLFGKFGNRGITEYELKEGLARFSDDTQMTLFTANGLLYGTTHNRIYGAAGSYTDCLAMAYQDWLKTQSSSFPPVEKPNCSFCLEATPDGPDWEYFLLTQLWLITAYL